MSTISKVNKKMRSIGVKLISSLFVHGDAYKRIQLKK